MKTYVALFLIITLLLSAQASPSGAHIRQGARLDPHLIHWLSHNVSAATQLPYSFYVPKQLQHNVFSRMEASGPINGAIERMITHGGLDIYDGAVYQLVQIMLDTPQSLKAAQRPIDYYWDGSIKDTWNVRAGYPISGFIYDPKNPQRVSSNPKDKGKRGFIFRILNADGDYIVTDPLNGNQYLAGFPQEDRLHWVDWKPVAGENAWVVLAAMQLYHQKYFDQVKGTYQHHEESREMRLAKELARAAMILQADCGGIRMAPLGTHRNLSTDEEKDFTESNWWYNQISTENNISWYAAFRMLYQVTQDKRYLKAMHGIERFMMMVWDKEEKVFHQGARWIKGGWVVNKKTFALDVQTWAIDCFGVEKIDAWLGRGAAWDIWRTARKRAGVFDEQGHLRGVGFTDEHDRLSVEWSAGALVALQELMRSYSQDKNIPLALAQEDYQDMREGVETLRHRMENGQAAYSYSSKRGWIPFGWFSHDPQVMSVASSGWMVFVDAGVNPFHLWNHNLLLTEPVGKI